MYTCMADIPPSNASQPLDSWRGFDVFLRDATCCLRLEALCLQSSFFASLYFLGDLLTIRVGTALLHSNEVFLLTAERCVITPKQT